MSGAQNSETPEAAASASGPSVTEAPARRTGAGVGRVLVAVYAILALAATGRSVFQIIDRFGEAPVAFLLSALAGVIYIVATIALGARLRTLALVTISIELIGVLVVGTLSLVAPASPGKTTNAVAAGTSTNTAAGTNLLLSTPKGAEKSK